MTMSPGYLTHYFEAGCFCTQTMRQEINQRLFCSRSFAQLMNEVKDESPSDSDSDSGHKSGLIQGVRGIPADTTIRSP